MTTLYETDLAAWVHEQIELLKTGQFDKIDMENFIDEVEGVVRTDKRSMKSHFVIMIAHILKWEYQPSKRSGSWLASINNARYEIEAVIQDSPSLKNYKEFAFGLAWEQARKLAIQETGLPSKDFPKCCPWTCNQAMKLKCDRDDLNK